MSHKINNPEWRDPTATEAVHNADQIKRQPLSIIDHQDVEPLSKFENQSDHKGRRRLLKALNSELAKMGKNNTKARLRIRDDIRRLSSQQFRSRVTPEEAQNFTGRRFY